MARVTYSGLVTDLKGSVGGSTFQRNFSGATARNRPAQRFFPSVLQSGAKNDFAAIASSWSRIAVSVQQLWNDYAALHPITDRWGNVRTLTGFQLYMQSNLNLLSIGVSLLSSPPAWLPPDIVPDFEMTAFDNSLHIGFYPAINFPDCDLCVYATAPTTSSKLTNRKNLWLIGHFPSPNGSIFDITTWYAQTFGLNWPQFFDGAYCNIAFQLMLVNRLTGVASPFKGFILELRSGLVSPLSSFGSSLSLFTPSQSFLESRFNGGCLNGFGLVAGADQPHLFRTVDFGKNWELAFTLAAAGYLNGILALPNGFCAFFESPSNNIVVSYDFGKTFTYKGALSFGTNVIQMVKAFGNVILGSLANGSRLVRSVDFFQTSSQVVVTSGSYQSFCVCHLEAGIVLCGMQTTAFVYRSIDNGLTWSAIPMPAGRLTPYKLTYCGNGIVLGTQAGSNFILKSVDYGLTWQEKQVLPAGQVSTAIASITGSCVVLVSWPSVNLWRSLDYGETFELVSSIPGITQVRNLAYMGKGKLLISGYGSKHIYVTV